MKGIFSPAEGWGVLLVYLALSYVFTLAFSRRMHSKVGFLAANRDIGWFLGALSIAAMWVWAPALFLSAQKSYQQGLAGLFWFAFMNVLCLAIFAYFAVRIRQRVPEGYTASAYMGEYTQSKRVNSIYVFQFGVLAMCSFAVQLLGAGLAISALTGIPYIWLVIVMGIGAIGYTMYSGLQASILTDWFQSSIIYLILILAVPFIVIKGGGWDVVRAGLGGISGEYSSLTSPAGIKVFLTFGVIVTIGLFSGPFGDQSFWQRAFAIKEKDVKKAFLWSAPFFAVIPLVMSLLGFMGAGLGIEAADPQLINLEVATRFLPQIGLYLFLMMLLSGLITTLDSNLAAVASLAGHDGSSRRGWGNISSGRWAMVLLALGGMAIALLPGMKILYLFMFYGIVRASTTTSTIAALLDQKLHERWVFWGVVVGMLIGVPIYAYGNYNGLWVPQLIGALISLLASGGIGWLGTKVWPQSEASRNRVIPFVPEEQQVKMPVL